MTEIVGRGASADVIAWRDGTVAKIFHPQYAYSLDLELARSRAVHALGAPCPAVLGRVEHEGRPGIEFERIDGPLLLDALRDGLATAAQTAERLAELHVSLHALRVPADSSLPRLSTTLERFLDALPEPEHGRARAEQAQVPDDMGVCHMDLHPGNVIVSGARLVVVDWVNACAGALALDAARSFVLMAWQSATRRDGPRQASRLALAECYRTAIQSRGGLAPESFDRAVGFASEALLREEPANPFAPEMIAAMPWRAR